MPSTYTTPHYINGLINIEGYRWLYEQAAQMREVVEVGCWHGAGTFCLCTACPGLVHAVDHWKGSPDIGDATHGVTNPAELYDRFWKNVGHFPNLRVHKGNSPDVATEFADRSVDMIVIDAGHDTASVTADLAAWMPKCRTLLCGHDFGHETVRRALESLGRPLGHHPADMWSIRCDD